MMKLRTLLLAGFLFSLLFPGLANAEVPHTTLMIQDIAIQLPFAPKSMAGDQLVDVQSLQGLLPITVEARGQERIIRYKSRQLDLLPGRVAAMLDGKWLMLKHAPQLEGETLFVPNRQLFDLLNITYKLENGHFNIQSEEGTIQQLQADMSKLEGPQGKIGFIGVLQPNRWIVVTKQSAAGGKSEGFGNLYEAFREVHADGKHTWKLTKLRTISDTTGRVYLEWMPNGSVFENIVSDKRPEFLFVETCNCAGRYQYGTMFTVTEMGLLPVWHSQATYDSVQKAAKGWVLVTHRKDSIPTRTSATMPYWEIHEMWNGQTFMITKQEYRDPLK